MSYLSTKMEQRLYSGLENSLLLFYNHDIYDFIKAILCNCIFSVYLYDTETSSLILEISKKLLNRGGKYLSRVSQIYVFIFLFL